MAGILGIGCFVAMTWHFGLDLEYRFEVAIITVAWTALVILGVMLALFFHLPPSEDHAAQGQSRRAARERLTEK